MSSSHSVLELVQSLEKGGRTRRILDTAAGLADLDWDVKVLSMAPPDDAVQQALDQDAAWLSLDKAPGLTPSYIVRLASLLRSERVELIHAHCESSYFYGGLAAKLSGIPIVGTYHRSDLSCYEPSFRLRAYASLLTATVAISHDRLGLMRDRLGIPEDRITLIHGGVDPNTFNVPEPETVRALRGELKVSGRRVLFSAGHLGVIKGHDTTLAALAELIQRWPDVLLVIAGDGSSEDYHRLEELIRRHSLEGHTRLLGQVANIPQWLALCEFFVQPSLEEGFGLVFAEAGACGKAVVATAVGGIKDIVVDGDTGLLVAPGDTGALANAMAQLLGQPEQAVAMGAAGLARIQSKFTVARMAASYGDLFRETLNGKR